MSYRGGGYHHVTRRKHRQGESAMMASVGGRLIANRAESPVRNLLFSADNLNVRVSAPPTRRKSRRVGQPQSWSWKHV
jgi:hypothetical protein